MRVNCGLKGQKNIAQGNAGNALGRKTERLLALKGQQ
jgi:hypothetical protein